MRDEGREGILSEREREGREEEREAVARNLADVYDEIKSAKRRPLAAVAFREKCSNRQWGFLKKREVNKKGKKYEHDQSK